MAVLNTVAAQLVEGYRRYPIDDHGKLRVQYFSLPEITVAGDANSTFDLARMPPGRVRIYPYLSGIVSSAWGAARTLDIGHGAYNRAVGEDDEVADVDAFADGLDIAAAGFDFFNAAVLKFDVYARREWMVTAIVLGGTMPIGATLQGNIVYAVE